MAMNHQQVLSKLAADHLVEVIHDDISRLTYEAMSGPKNSLPDHATISANVITQILLRWNCVLNATTDEVAALYQQKTWLGLAAVLHKHGFHDEVITQRALQAVDQLNDAVALSDDFHRKSAEIKALIAKAPTPLSRRPAIAKAITFWRKGDVASVQIGERFHAIYVYDIEGANTAPLVEVYDFVADKKPLLDDVLRCRAKGRRFHDGTDRVERYAVYGMKNMPDLAHQFHLLGSGVAEGPDHRHLKPATGLYVMSDLFRLLSDLRHAFKAE